MGRTGRRAERRAASPGPEKADRRRSGPPLRTVLALAFVVGVVGTFVLSKHKGRPSGTGGATPPSTALADARAHLARARRHMGAQDLMHAQSEIEKAEALAPDDPEVVFTGGEIAYRGLQMEKAERQFRRVTELDPGSSGAFASLALVLIEEGQAQAAVAAAGRAIDLDPKDPRLQALLGKGLLRLGRLQEAAEAIEGALAGGVRSAEAHASLGRARDLLGQRKEALRAFDVALERDPGLPLAHYWRADCLRKAGRTREAERELSAYRQCQDRLERIFRLQLQLSQDEGDVRAWLELARLRVERGIPSQAVPAVARAESLAPGDPEVRRVGELVRRAVATRPDVES
jgi:tetratricopeptide (TPR) repeat protein